MKHRTNVVHVQYRPTEEEIRAKALELYVQSGWIHDRDLDNWLEAEAFLLAHPPAHAPAELHHSTPVAATV